MAYTTINKSTAHFNTKLWTGNGSAGNAQTGVGFQPDFTWIKARAGSQGSQSHILNNVVRGAGKFLYCDSTDAESTDTNRLTSFNADGFTVGSNNSVNASSTTYVGWNWKAGNAQGSSNTDGSINTTYTSVNTTSGFSISQYTGTGSNATVGHGLGVAPKWIFTKCTSHTSDWMVYYGDATDFLKLNENNATEDLDTVWNDTAPTNSVFSLGSNGDVNTSGRTYIAFCFAEKTGFSKVGTYTGNGSTNGVFNYTGFKPTFVIIKRLNSNQPWCMWDNKRSPFNVSQNYLYANTSDAEGSGASINIDMLSNGFKLRASGSFLNTSGDSFIYIAFGQSLVGSNNIPATAR